MIFAAAKLGGEIAERFRRPAVLGELLAGVLLGLTPLREAAGNPAIAFIAAIGIILLLFETGLENELADFIRVGRSAASVAVIGVALPLAAGFGLMYLINGDYRQALFLGATLTATSIGITTRVLSDLGKTSSKGVHAKIVRDLGRSLARDQEQATITLMFVEVAMSRTRRSLDPALVQAVAQTVQARLPAGEPLTLDALEDAILEVFQQLGPAVAEEVAAPRPVPQKRGRRGSAAGSPSAGCAGNPANS